MKKGKQLLTVIAVLGMVFVVGSTTYAAGDVVLSEETTQKQEGHRLCRERGDEQKGTELFDAAIEAGILTETDLEAIEAHREANQPDMEAVKAATEGMTREEVRAYMVATYGPKTEPFARLVEDGILTQDQVDALLELVPERPEPVEGRGFMHNQKGQRGSVNNRNMNGRDAL